MFIFLTVYHAALPCSQSLLKGVTTFESIEFYNDVRGHTVPLKTERCRTQGLPHPNHMRGLHIGVIRRAEIKIVGVVNLKNSDAWEFFKRFAATKAGRFL